MNRSSNCYYYTIDIAFIHNSTQKNIQKVTETVVNEDTIFNLTDNYPNCEWIFSNWNPVTVNNNSGHKGKNAFIQRNIGFKVTVLSQFENIIRDVQNTPGLFINMVIAYNNDTIVEKVYQYKSNSKSSFNNVQFQRIHDLCVLCNDSNSRDSSDNHNDDNNNNVMNRNYNNINLNPSDEKNSLMQQTTSPLCEVREVIII